MRGIFYSQSVATQIRKNDCVLRCSRKTGVVAQFSTEHTFRHDGTALPLRLSVYYGVVMSNVARITISVEEPLLAQFESYVKSHGYPTRSEAMQGLMRQTLVTQEWQKGSDVAGAISVIYDHHKRGTGEKLTDVQHDFGELIVCAQHVHLDHHNCMEIIVVRGRAVDIRDLLSRLNAIKGIKHSSLMMGTTGKDVR